MKKKSLLFPALALALVLSLCLALAACGSGGVNALTAESGVTAEGAFENGSALNTAHHASDSEQGKAAIAAIDKPYDNAKVAVFDITLTKDGEKRNRTARSESLCRSRSSPTVTLPIT